MPGHEHDHEGQVLRHAHPGGSQPHGYYEHAEDPDARKIGRERKFTAIVNIRYCDPYTGAVTTASFCRTGVLAPDVAGARTSGIGLARSVTLAELMDDPDTTWHASAAPE